MRKLILISLSIFLIGMNLTSKSQEMTKEEKTSYALGANVGENFKNAGISLNINSFVNGVTDAMSGNVKFTQQELEAIFTALNQEIQERQNQEVVVEKEKGAKFLAENKTQEGVIETASGLQYKVVVMGSGAKPVATDKVKVHYHGTLMDGTVFDSSVQRGEPISFELNRVIPGWTEGVQLMPIGSKFIFYIPSDLAYGDRGAPPTIKPGATLIFEVELIDIETGK